MEVLDLQPQSKEIGGKVFAHLLGQRRNKNPLSLIDGLSYLSVEILHLAFGRLDSYLRVQETCGPYELLHYLHRFSLLPFSRSGGYIYPLSHLTVELIILQRPVVQCGRKTEPIFHKIGLTGPVSFIHGSYLGKSHMAFIYEGDEVIREIVKKNSWSFSRLTASKRS